MATTTFSKARFIQFLEKQLDENDIVLMTQDLEGNLSVTPKRNVKKVMFGFAADAFKRKEDIGHIVFGETPVAAFCICKKKDVSDDTYNMVLEGDKKFLGK